MWYYNFCFQAEDGIRDLVRSRGLGDVYKRQALVFLLLGNIKTESPKELHENIRFIQIITSIIVVAIENKRLFKQRLQQDALERDLDAVSYTHLTLPTSDLV